MIFIVKTQNKIWPKRVYKGGKNGQIQHTCLHVSRSRFNDK